MADAAGWDAWMPGLPGLVVVTDDEGMLRAVAGEGAATLGLAADAKGYIAGLFTRPAAIFLETHLWPTLRHDGRFDECSVALKAPDGQPWPCLVSARRMAQAPGVAVLWLFFPAQERTRFEAELVAARGAAQALASELDQLARTDPLTGLGNRRALEAAFVASVAAAERDGTTGGGALLMVDADHFKAINDRWGHDAGDAVLVGLAHALRDSLRRTDTVVRMGGEEFAAWLPGADPAAVARVAEAVHARVRELRLPDEGGPPTVSIGVAAVDGDLRATPLGALIKRADEAVYAAKSAGRNRTCWAA